MTYRTAPLFLYASLVALTTTLIACSGGTESSTPAPVPPTPPTGNIQIGFEPPSENVVEPNATRSLSVDVDLGANPAPDGIEVTFEMTPSTVATAAPVRATTVNGKARTTMTTVATAPVGSTFQVKASASSNQNTATDHLTFHVRPAPQPMQVLVPIYPPYGTPSPWEELKNSAISYPDVPIVAIANPNGGVLPNGTTADSALITSIDDFKAVGGTSKKVVGYVATGLGSSGTISVTDVKITIDNYLSLYPNLDGFFLDGMSTDSSRLSYYQDIYKYITVDIAARWTAPPPLVIGNPANYPARAYTDTADVLVTFAGSAAAYKDVNPQPANTWVYAKENIAQAAMVHTASTCTDMQNAVLKANTPLMNTGMIYVTNMGSGAPWSALPAYWRDLLGTVDAIKRNAWNTRPLC